MQAANNNPNHLGVQHIDTEVTQRCLEEVILSSILQQGVVHAVGPNLNTFTLLQNKTTT